eukprot:3970710-Pleurochrysis_carterae.AAC.1
MLGERLTNERSRRVDRGSHGGQAPCVGAGGLASGPPTQPSSTLRRMRAIGPADNRHTPQASGDSQGGRCQEPLIRRYCTPWAFYLVYLFVWDIRGVLYVLHDIGLIGPEDVVVVGSDARETLESFKCN